MSKLFLKLAFGGAVALTAFSAQALPSASQHSLVSSDVIQVAGGCGRGFHRGPRGGCRPNVGGLCRNAAALCAQRREGRSAFAGDMRSEARVGGLHSSKAHRFRKTNDQPPKNFR